MGEKTLKEVPMAGERKTVTESKKKKGQEAPETERQSPEAEKEELESYEPASAKDIPRPVTTLARPPSAKFGKISVSLLGDLASAPSLEEIAKLNQQPISQGRTPFITVIQAVLAKAGGTMNMEDLAAQALKHWNRPLPTCPYTPEQFVYLMARNSDNIKISE